MYDNVVGMGVACILAVVFIWFRAEVVAWFQSLALSSLSTPAPKPAAPMVFASEAATCILSTTTKPRERTLKRTTLREIRGRYGYTVRVQRDTVPWSDALCAVILKTRAGEKVSREEWRTALRCSPNTLQKQLDEYQARQTVDTPLDAHLTDAEFVEKYRRKSPAPLRRATA